MLRNPIIILALLIPFLGNCAMYMPLSQEVMYDPPVVENDVIPEEEGVYAEPEDENRKGITIGISSVALPSALKEQLRARQISDVKTDLSDINTWQTSQVMVGRAYRTGAKSAIGIGIHPLQLGTDATFHLVKDFWVTANFQFPGYIRVNRELILQKPVYRQFRGGISAGIFYRYEHLLMYDGGVYLEPFEWYGGQFSGRLMGGHDRGLINFQFKAGYLPAYESSLFSLGFSVSFFPKRSRQGGGLIEDLIR